MGIRAIFYDLDGTLRMNMPASWKAFTEHAGSLGLGFQRKDQLRAARWEHYYFAESPELHADHSLYQDEQSFWTNYGVRILAVLGASPEQAADLAPRLHQHMQASYRPQDVIPADLVQTLKTLQDQGYLLGVLSNRGESFADYLAELGLNEYFSLAVFAGETGIFKPDPAVFYYLLEKAGVSAGESIYVGDNYYADVVGSRLAGMSPVLLDVDGLFPDSDCPVIQEHSQLLYLLEGRL